MCDIIISHQNKLVLLANQFNGFSVFINCQCLVVIEKIEKEIRKE